MPNIYCLGEAVSDMIFRTEKAEIIENKEKKICFEFGEKIAVQDFHSSYGGSGLNVCMGLKRLEINAIPIFTLGVDIMSEKIMAMIRERSIDSSFIVQSERYSTKTAAILVGPGGDRTILVYHGKGKITENDIKWDKIEDDAWFYLGPLPEGTEKLIDMVVETVKEKNLHLVVNPGTVQIGWGEEANEKVMSESELYVLNKNEAIDIYGGGSDEELLQKIRAAGADKVIITKGTDGSVSTDGRDIIRNNIIKVETKDATGAGDAFLSGVVGGLLHQESLQESLKWGMINSSSVVKNYGAQDGLLTMDEILK